MGPNLMLSWLVRAQVGAKRGNLTLLGGLRGNKLELKEALEAPKEAPREPKWGPRRATCEQPSEPGPRGGVGEGSVYFVYRIILTVFTGSYHQRTRAKDLHGLRHKASADN